MVPYNDSVEMLLKPCQEVNEEAGSEFKLDFFGPTEITAENILDEGREDDQNRTNDFGQIDQQHNQNLMLEDIDS